MKIASYLIVIFLAPTFILLNFRLLVFNHNFYKEEFAKLNVYSNFHSRETVDSQAQNLINFLCCNQKLDENFYLPRELIHLRDVKKLIRIANTQLFLMIILVSIISTFLLYQKRTKLFLNSLAIGSLACLLAILFLSLAAFINFDLLFLNFHYITFTNDYWQLPQTANLIKLFPQQFFVDFTNRIALQTIIMAVTIFVSVKVLELKLIRNR